MFEKEKKERLSELYLPDRSPKGNVDIRVMSLLDTINSNDNYYTMSSCSGRSSLAKVKTSGKGLEWLFVTHEEMSIEDFKDIISNLPEGEVYFRYEGLILHVCAKTMDDAISLMTLAQNNGCKHAGVIGANKRIVVELIDMFRLDVPIAKNGRLLVSKDYLELLVCEANKKLNLSHKLIDRLKSGFN